MLYATRDGRHPREKKCAQRLHVTPAPVLAYRHTRLGFIHAWGYEVAQPHCRAFGTMIERSVLLSEGGARLSCSLTSIPTGCTTDDWSSGTGKAPPASAQLYYRD
jgi:hypothetical protein